MLDIVCSMRYMLTPLKAAEIVVGAKLLVALFNRVRLGFILWNYLKFVLNPIHTVVCCPFSKDVAFLEFQLNAWGALQVLFTLASLTLQQPLVSHFCSQATSNYCWLGHIETYPVCWHLSLWPIAWNISLIGAPFFTAPSFLLPYKYKPLQPPTPNSSICLLCSLKPPCFAWAPSSFALLGHESQSSFANRPVSCFSLISKILKIVGLLYILLSLIVTGRRASLVQAAPLWPEWSHVTLFKPNKASRNPILPIQLDCPFQKLPEIIGRISISLPMALRSLWKEVSAKTCP